MTQRTASYQLLEAKLGKSLAEYVTDRRAAGESWQSIRDDLVVLTGVKIAAASLRNWFTSETVGAA